MPDWNHFQVQHVLNSSVDAGYAQWSRSDWNDFLRRRIGNEFGRKNIDSVIIAAPETILQDFENLNDHVQHDKGPDFYWSNSRYQIYVMTLNKSTTNDASRYDVRRLDPMYFLAKIYTDPNRPVHFHAQYPERVTRGNVNCRLTDYPFVP